MTARKHGEHFLTTGCLSVAATLPNERFGQAVGSLCGNNCPLSGPPPPVRDHRGEIWGNRGIRARSEIAEQTQTDRDSAWSAAAQEVFSGTLTSAGLEILVDHYSAGDVVARSGDNGG